MNKNIHNTPSTNRVFRTFFKWISFILILLSLWFCAVFIVSVIFRIQYPYELSWYEDEHLYQVKRILTGQALYSVPTLSYVPYVYGPVFFYIASFFGLLFGIHIYILRMVSILSTTGTIALIFLFLYKETHNKIAGLLGVGLFLATYPLSNYTQDVGRVDALFVFFITLSIYLTRFGASKKFHIGSALFIILAVFIKQIGLLALIIFTCYYLFENRKYRKVFISAASAFLIFGFIYMHIAYKGWYTFYTVSLTSSHTIRLAFLFTFWLYDLMFFLPIALFGLFFILKQVVTSKSPSQRFLIYIVISMMGIALISRARYEGDQNVLLPAYVALSLCFGLFYKYLDTLNKEDTTFQHSFNSTFLSLFILVQMIMLLYNPLKPIPTINDRAQIIKLFDEIKKTHGDVYLIHRREIITKLNKPRYAHLHAFKELVGFYGNKKPTQEGTYLAQKMKRKIINKHFGAIILDLRAAYSYEMNPFIKELHSNYYVTEKITIPIDKATYYIFKPKN